MRQSRLNKRRTDLDRVWRAVVTHTLANGAQIVEYFGPFGLSGSAAAAVTRAVRQGWYNATTTGIVQSAVTDWETRGE